MTRSLGEFGTAVAEATGEVEPTTFDLTNGVLRETFYVDEIPFVAFARLAEAAHNGLSSNVSEGAASIYSMMRGIIAADPGEGRTVAERKASAKTKEEEWHRFESASATQKTSLDDLLKIVMAVLGAGSGKEVKPPGGSSNGSRKTVTSRSSKPKSLHAGNGAGRGKTIPSKAEPVTPAMLADLGG